MSSEQEGIALAWFGFLLILQIAVLVRKRRSARMESDQRIIGLFKIILGLFFTTMFYMLASVGVSKTHFVDRNALWIGIGVFSLGILELVYCIRANKSWPARLLLTGWSMIPIAIISVERAMNRINQSSILSALFFEIVLVPLLLLLGLYEKGAPPA